MGYETHQQVDLQRMLNSSIPAKIEFLPKPLTPNTEDVSTQELLAEVSHCIVHNL